MMSFYATMSGQHLPYLIVAGDRHYHFVCKKEGDFLNEPLKLDRYLKRKEGNRPPFTR